MFIKRFAAAILLGVGMELGTILAKKSVQLASDPYERTVIKQKFNKVKDALLKKEEES